MPWLLVAPSGNWREFERPLVFSQIRISFTFPPALVLSAVFAVEKIKKCYFTVTTLLFSKPRVLFPSFSLTHRLVHFRSSRFWFYHRLRSLFMARFVGALPAVSTLTSSRGSGETFLSIDFGFFCSTFLPTVTLSGTCSCLWWWRRSGDLSLCVRGSPIGVRGWRKGREKGRVGWRVIVVLPYRGAAATCWGSLHLPWPRPCYC